MSTNPFILWLKEAVARLGQKSPYFFKVVGAISLIVAGLGAIPEILQMLELPFPDWADGPYAKIMLFAGAWGKLIAMFAVRDASTAPLPYTEQKTEQKAIEKAESANENIK